MSNWKNYVAACLRVADLVESRREPGTAPSFNKTAEGRSDALWLTIGIYILEFLSERAEDVGSEYVSILPAVEALLRQYPTLSDDDIQFVCKLLSCETVFYFSDGEKVFPVGRTALIEQLRSSRQYRLTATGRMTCDVARQPSGLLYADDDARKILRAMDIGDYGRVLRFCREIRSRLVQFAHELKRAAERPGGSVLLEEFVQHREVFEQVVTNTQETISVGLTRLRSEEIADQIDAWAEDQDEPITAMQMRRVLKDLAGTLEGLVRIFADLVQTLISTNRQQSRLFDFKAFSHALIYTPPTEKRIANFLRGIGPCQGNFLYAVPQDLEGSVSSRIVESSSIRQVFTDGQEVVDAPQWVTDLFEHHRSDIMAELNSTGHISLKIGIERGWFKVDEIEMLSSLTGLFHCPDSLGLKDRTLSLGLGQKLQVRAGEMNFVGDDVALVLTEEKEF